MNTPTIAPLILLLFAAGVRSSGSRYLAHQNTAPSDTLMCADSLVPRDTIAGVVKISVRHQDTTAKLPSNFEGLFADEFQSRFKAPSQLPLITIDPDKPCKDSICSSASPVVRVDAYAMALQDGTMQKISVIS